MDDNVEDQAHSDGIDEEGRMPANESSNESGYSGHSPYKERRLIREVPEEHKQRRPRGVIEDRCNIVVLSFYEEAHEHAKRNIYTFVFKLMEQTAVKALFTARADQLLNNKI